MNKIVLDASAVLAFMNKEQGFEIVEPYLPHSMISTINLSEVISILLAHKIEAQEANTLLDCMMNEIVPFDEGQALMTANLKKITQAYGLSLADRACLGLAKIKHLPVLTADKVWKKLDISVKVILIR